LVIYQGSLHDAWSTKFKKRKLVLQVHEYTPAKIYGFLSVRKETVYCRMQVLRWTVLAAVNYPVVALTHSLP